MLRRWLAVSLIAALLGCSKSRSPGENGAGQTADVDGGRSGIGGSGGNASGSGGAGRGLGGRPAPLAGAGGTAPASDSGVADAGAFPPLSDCKLQPAPEPFAPPILVSDLASLCDALAAAGIAHCPADRASYLGDLACTADADFPMFERRCGVDHVMTWSMGTTLWWYFDATTGALIGAALNVSSGALPCGATRYRAGEDPWCPTLDGSCWLCVTEPDDCPADISASLHSTPCPAAAAQSPDCTCGGEAGASGFPEPRAECGAAEQCERCAGGTCWATCRCWRSGTRRYLTECTE